MQLWMSGCGMKFTIIQRDEIALARVASIITQEFVAATATGEKRLDTVDFETKCIRVLIEIKGASSLSEAPAVCLAEQFKHYILDVGLQLSEESNAILEVDESSIEITPEHMPEDGHPLVNITHQEFFVPNSEAVILQTYIISSPPAWSIEWFQIKAEDNEISLEINSKKYYGGSELSPSLIIRNINVDDQGWYICRATNNNGTGCSNKTFVRINNEPAGTEDNPGTLVKDTSDIQ
ncbi:uncharacterized protein LOC110458132, partial [Mizuhopecten yessoensis]|uniref:uncharacterized protein LOC110458132 n=1 Tax=Mizuhopecten yessoensis TaxID=6573 RepID=UPI000B459315